MTEGSQPVSAEVKKPILANAKIGYIGAIVCTFMWGLSIPLLQRGYNAMGINSQGDTGIQLLFAGVRFIISGLLVYAILAISHKKVIIPKKSNVLPYLSLGLLQTTAQYIFYYIGIGNTKGTNTALITSCISFFTVLLAPIFFKDDKLTLPKIGGSVIGFIGIILVTGSFELNVNSLLGDGLILISTICAASGNILSKKISPGRNPLEIASFQLMFGGAVLVALGFILGGQLEFKNIESVVYLIMLSFTSAIAFSLWSTLLKYHPASKISVFNLLVPVFGTVLSGLLLGENIFRIETGIALLLIAVGIVLVNINFQKQKN